MTCLLSLIAAVAIVVAAVLWPLMSGNYRSGIPDLAVLFSLRNIFLAGGLELDLVAYETTLFSLVTV